MTKGTHLLRSALLALLALAVISGGSLAAGDLFDDDYSDCPHRTRLRDGQISDLSVNRDSDDEDHVNVSWSATDPATWGLGANAYSTSLVVILDDGGDPDTETLSLGSKSVTFEGVDTGVKVTVQMAIVVDTADGDYLISDILEKSVNQSLTEPAFSRGFLRVTRAATGGANASADGATPAVAPLPELNEETPGTFYYVGYNENFGNYMATGLTTVPSTPRLRIGLAHGGEDTDARDDVDFDSYILRISDEDGDVVSEGDDIATVDSDYGTRRFIYGLYSASLEDANDPKFSNVRISDDGFLASVQGSGPALAADATVTPAITWGPTTPILVTGGVTTGLSNFWPQENPAIAAVASGTDPANASGSGALTAVYALPPDEHRDFPIDVFSSDETYKVTAWAINDDDEVISPVSSLTVRLFNESRSGITNIDDYIDLGDEAATPDARFTDGADATGVSNAIVTVFTVIK